VEIEYIAIPLIGLLAFFVKGIIGAGTTAVMVSLSSLFLDPKSTVVLSSFVNMFGGFMMLRMDPLRLRTAYWLPIAAMMTVGSIMGAALLKIVPGDTFKTVLGLTFFLSSWWFLLRASEKTRNTGAPPGAAGGKDLGVGTFAGFCGGFIGINSPPLVLYFGRRLNKRNLRQLLVIIFIPAAFSQTATFAVNGLLTPKIIFLGLLTLPTLYLGIRLGNRTFESVSDAWFRRLMGILLIVLSIRMLL
jgi:uncharacterized protein